MNPIAIRRFLILFPLLLLHAHAWASGDLNVQVGKDAIYLQWHKPSDNASSFVIYRSKGNGRLTRLAEVSALADAAKGNAVLAAAPDALSRNMTFAPDFVQKIQANPNLDQALTMAAAGYAEVRGLAYLDRDVSSRTQYHYRLAMRAADGGETVIGETDADSGRPTMPDAPEVRVALTASHGERREGE